MRGFAALALVALLLAGGCRREGGEAEPSGPLAEARALIEQGQYDAALARLGEESGVEGLYLLGRAWAGKASAARRTPFGELSPEERQAHDLFQRAIAARPDYAPAHQALADMLAPHALTRAGRRAAPSETVAAPGPDLSVERVLRAYGEAVQADPADKSAVSALIDFATRAGRLAEAEAGYRELVQRDRENPDLLVRFGDFLAGPRQDPEGALGVYAQALIWRPDDAETRSKMASLHLEAARGHLDRREYPAAEMRLREAQKQITDPRSPQAARLRQLQDELAEVRGRR